MKSRSTTQSLRVQEVADLIGKPKEYIYGIVQVGLVDFGTYYKKSDSNRGSYIFPPGRVAEYLGISVKQLFRELKKIEKRKRREGRGEVTLHLRALESKE